MGPSSGECPGRAKKKRGQTQKYFRTKFRNKSAGSGWCKGSKRSQQVGGAGPQGCEPGAGVGAVAAKMLKIMIFVRYTGENQPWSAASAFLLPPSPFDLCSEPVYLPVLSQHLAHLCHGLLQIHQERCMNSSAGVCHGLADVFSTPGK